LLDRKLGGLIALVRRM